MKRIALVLAVALLCVIVPGARADDTLFVLQKLSDRRLSPAPLVFTQLPPAMPPYLQAIQNAGGARSKNGYVIRAAHYTPNGPDAIVALSRGDYKSIKAALRAYRRDRFKVRSTRIRHRRGYVLTRKLSGPREWILEWVEDGHVYSLGTGTPKKVSVKDLRSTAAGLEHLTGQFLGDYFQPGSNNTDFGAVLVTTEHTVTGHIDFGTDNCTYNGSPAAGHGGGIDLGAVRLNGNAFSAPIGGGWTGTLSGTVSTNAVGLTLHGTGSFNGENCDTGQMAVTATPFHQNS
jgi:hypothetical protein